jgi:hypothetical protein
MKKSVIFVVLMLMMVMEGNTIEAAERGDRDQDDFFYASSPIEQIMQFLVFLIIVISIIVISGIVTTKIGDIATKSKNPNHSFLPSVALSQPSQYAFMEKTSCSHCGRFMDSETNVCPFCGNDLGGNEKPSMKS